MRGVFFEDRTATVARSPYRADVALFVGYVDRRRHLHDGGVPTDTALSQLVVPTGGVGGDPTLYPWLVANGWARGNEAQDRAAGLDELVNVPVPIDGMETFERLFAWEWRPWGDQFCDTYLGAAVRSFFTQGGRLCYVVRVGAPWPVPLTVEAAADVVANRAVRMARLVPGFPSSASVDPVDPTTWRGVWVVCGLPDVSTIALPDLPDVVRAAVPADPGLPPPPAVAAVFEECATGGVAAGPNDRVSDLLAPTTDDAGYTAWARAVSLVVGEIATPRPAGFLREMMVVASVPRPADDRVGADLLGYLASIQNGPQPIGVDTDVAYGGLESEFLQLAYPWLATAASTALPDGLEPPDGTLCGAIARNALERGTFRSLGGRPLIAVLGVDPPLPGKDLSDPSDPGTLGGRVALVGDTADGFAVLSDATTSLDPTFRLGHVERLLGAIRRALRTLGEGLVFEASNEATWAHVRARVAALLRGFWRAGALKGASEAEAFTVRCDRSTMSQDDLDNGRLVTEVSFALTVSIQRINVVLTRTGDTVTLERAA